jgi:hypothetical protein
MRRTLGTLAALLTLAGCGDDTSSEPMATETPAESPVVVLVHATAGGGEAAAEATDVTGENALTSYVEQFDDALAAEVTSAAGKVDVGDGEVRIAQVVSVGCDVPPGATAQDGAIVPEKAESPLKECFAPVTTVAVAAARAG